ncbi:MAG: lytic transglycosylase [Tabrizicola sp.]|jgi:hypothetical protein|nr:lytic transglycosylase [Tabrizicola sp.]
MIFRRIAAAFALTTSLSSCTVSTPDPAPGQSPTDQPQAGPSTLSLRWSGEPDGARWTALAMAAAQDHGLDQIVPQDIADWCPGYAAAGPADRRAFWAGLMSTLAKYESNFRPEVEFTENFPDSTGALVVSRGLLQLSRESARGYGCPITTGEDLHDPAVNLDCSARILKHWAVKDGQISSNQSPWKGAARYWSPFRSTEKRADMAGWTRTQPFCSTG